MYIYLSLVGLLVLSRIFVHFLARHLIIFAIQDNKEKSNHHRFKFKLKSFCNCKTKVVFTLDRYQRWTKIFGVTCLCYISKPYSSLSPIRQLNRVPARSLSGSPTSASCRSTTNSSSAPGGYTSDGQYGHNVHHSAFICTGVWHNVYRSGLGGKKEETNKIFLFRTRRRHDISICAIVS